VKAVSALGESRPFELCRNRAGGPAPRWEQRRIRRRHRLDVLLSEKAGALNERQRRILEESSLNCARPAQIVDDFLSFSALEAGKITLRLEEGDLRACLEAARLLHISYKALLYKIRQYNLSVFLK
jgi:signal transduction histidine kinase